MASRSSSSPPTADVFPVDAAIDALESATQAIAGELDLDRVLQLIVDSVRELVHARYAALGIADSSGRMERFITSGITAEERTRIGPLPRGHGLLGLIIREGRSYRIPEISAHPDAYGFPPHHPPMRSFLGVPVRTAGEAVGNFYLTDKVDRREFDEGDQRLVEMFALHAGIAIQNARLHARVRELAIVDERLRIGRDLHDGIIQSIYAVGLSLEDVPELMAEDQAEAVARVDRAIDRLTSTIGEIRSFITGLGTGSGQVPIGERLAALSDELVLSSGTRIRVDLAVESLAGAEDGVAPGAADQLVLIAREALSNAIRHSAASRVVVRLETVDDALVLTVEDDGRGFEPEARRGDGHLGLANLRDRAAAIGADLEIEGRPGVGARIIVRLPFLAPEERPT